MPSLRSYRSQSMPSENTIGILVRDLEIQRDKTLERVKTLDFKLANLWHIPHTIREMKKEKLQAERYKCIAKLADLMKQYKHITSKT